MSQPIYFLPGVVAAQLVDAGKFVRRVLSENGLGEIFADVIGPEHDAFVAEIGCGPGGRTGCLLGYQTPQERVTTGIPLGAEIPRLAGYVPDKQEWQQVSERLWIGYETANPPTGAKLKRKRMHAGYDIELADGFTWHVPVIRRQDDSTELPVDMSFGLDGRLVEVIKNSGRQIWEDAKDIAACFFSRDFTGVDKAKAFDLAVRVLGINYRFGHAEQRIVKAVDSTNYFGVLSLAVDYPLFAAVEAAAKKN